MIEMAPGIELFENIFLDSNDLILSIPDALWDTKQPSGEYGRVADIVLLSNDHLIVKNLFNKFQDNVKPLIEKYMLKYNTIYLKEEIPTLLKYGSGQGFSNHVDDHPQLERRRMSLVYYINDNYSGGNIEFPRFNINIKPKANSLIIFPSSYTYNHIVHPVEDGLRYCIVQWLC